MALPPHGPDEVRRIAALARIRLTAEEVEGLAADFAAVLGYVDRLRTRDEADEVEPLVHAVPSRDPAGALRPDAPAGAGGAAIPPGEVVEMAPDGDGSRLRVPRVLEEGR